MLNKIPGGEVHLGKHTRQLWLYISFARQNQMESFQQPAFDITELTDEFDPSDTPKDGIQYLRKVMFEREKCPAIVVRPLEIAKATKSTASTATEWIVRSFQAVKLAID